MFALVTSQDPSILAPLIERATIALAIPSDDSDNFIDNFQFNVDHLVNLKGIQLYDNDSTTSCSSSSSQCHFIHF